MTTTSPLIVLTMGAAVLSSASSPTTHSRADIDDLVTGDAMRTLKYATYEPDKWLLDGSYHFAPDPANIGFVSASVSLVDGTFFTDPVVTLTLDAAIDIEQGITLEFSNVSDDYCVDLDVEYFDSVAASITSDNHTPTGYNYFAEAPTNPVLDVLTIEITFNETSEAYRHIKLLGVYVDGVLFDKENIRTANIIEEIDPISVSSPSNELNFTLHSEDGDFSIVDPQGIYAELEKGQIVDAYELVDTGRIYMGRFYTKPWESKSENLAYFECEDALSLLENETTYGYWWQKITGWDAEDVMDNIMGDVFSESGTDSDFDYEVDASLASVSVYGWLDITNRRAALQQLAFSIGGYVTCSRSDKVEIRPLELADNITAWDFILDNSDTSRSEVALIPLITGIRIVSHNFFDLNPVVGEPVIFDDDVVAGDLIIYPQKEDKMLGIVNVDIVSGDTTATVASTSSNKTNFAEFDVTGSGRLVLIDHKVNVHNRTEYILNVPDLPVGTIENIIVIENATFVNQDNVAEVALRVLSYYQQRYKMQTKLFASEIAVGDTAKIDTQSNKKLSGVVDRMDIDLSGGFVQKTKTSGVILPYNPTWYGVEYLMLAGGGAGASHDLAGGGGAGEYVHGIDLLVINTAYNIVIGAGGTGSIGGSGTNGNDTTFNSHTANGGGHGGKGSHSAAAAEDGNDGGNGGGGGGNDGGGADGAGGAGYRFEGGDGSNGVSNYGGGGGGGNGEEGSGGATSNPTTGAGGDGETNDITGSDVVYGGGGGGIGLVDAGPAGTGGGGAGKKSGGGDDGTDGLGGGGGASDAAVAGGDGGSGLAILRVLTSDYSGTTTGSPTVTVDGLYTVLEYTSNGSYTA